MDKKDVVRHDTISTTASGFVDGGISKRYGEAEIPTIHTTKRGSSTKQTTALFILLMMSMSLGSTSRRGPRRFWDSRKVKSLEEGCNGEGHQA